jgi:DNA-binding XRE family transcriptional regulator
MEKEKKKVMTEEELGMISRFKDEIEKIKTPKTAIADKVEFSAQTFTNITKGRNLPGLLLLHKIHLYFPEFDPTYVITGVRAGDESGKMQKLLYDLDLKDAVIRNLVGMSERNQKTNVLGKTRTALKSPNRLLEIRKEQGSKATAEARRRSKMSVGRGQGIVYRAA